MTRSAYRKERTIKPASTPPSQADMQRYYDMLKTPKPTSKQQHTCAKCEQVSEYKLCPECYCVVCGDELENGWCVECSRDDVENE